MNKLSGTAAEARLGEAWERVLSQDPASQQIIHVLTRPTEYPTWLTGFQPFEVWIRNGCMANDEVWRTFAEIANPWRYIRNARRASAIGIPNVRIFTLKHTEWDYAPSWLRYMAEVHFPAISALAGETLYQVWLEDCRDSGLPDRDYDVNLWGADGIMLAGYRHGDVDWRVFLPSDCNDDRSREERDFIISMHDFASTRGQLVKLPSELQARSGFDIEKPFVNQPSLR